MRQKMNQTGIRFIALAVVLCTVLLSFVACGKEETGNVQQIYHELSSQFSEKMKFAEALTPVDQETACLTYGMEESMVAEAVLYVGSGAHVDELAMFLAADGVNVQQLKAAAEARIDAQKKLYSNYNTEELPKLDSPIVFVKDNLVVLCIGGEEATVAYLKSVLK